MEKKKYKAKILVADDDKDAREMIKDFFTDNGFKVEMASGGKEAVKKLNSFTPDILLLDMKMPDMSGEEVLDYINNNDIDVGVIIITGFPELIENKSLLNGIFDCLVKPFNLDYLKNTVLTTVVLACKENGLFC